jgi:IrrE N-terminal-like domain
MTHSLSDPIWQRVVKSEREIVERYVNERPVRIAALANELGMRVSKSPMEPNLSGWIKPIAIQSADAPSGFEIHVNKYDTPERQRFTVAHEIGHFLLHRDQIQNGIVDNVLFRSKLSNRVEAEANRIAASILMPSDLVEAELEPIIGDLSDGFISRLAQSYKVSEAAMRIRVGA